MVTQKNVFVGVKEAVLRAPINLHRIQQLSSRDQGLHEETVTDLLLNEMTGSPYEIAATCSACFQADCKHWGAGSALSAVGVRAKALTKNEEGGHTGRGEAPAAADWILEVTGDGAPVRLMFQAKAGRMPSGKKEKTQLGNLILAAGRLDAVPLYIFYTKHEDPHKELQTQCPYRTTAAETSMLVVSAEVVRQLKARTPTETWALQARPLSCLAGCRCLGTGRSDLYAAILGFTESFGRAGAPNDDGGAVNLAGVPKLTIDSLTESLPRKHLLQKPQASAAPERVQRDAVVVIRMGAPGTSDVDTSDPKRRIGFHTDEPLSDDEWRDATRMYWRMNKLRAAHVQYLAASYRGKVYRLYKVSDEDGVIWHGIRDGRIEFQVEDLELGSEIGQKVTKVAEDRLRGVAKSQAPFVYADL